MSRTGGFGATALLREELIRELFTDTESLFTPNMGLQGAPAVIPDRASFNLPLAIFAACNQLATTPPGIQGVTFRRTAAIAPASVRLETFGSDPGVRMAMSAALTDDALTSPNAALTTLPATSVFFDFELVLRAFPFDAPLLAPGVGLPYFLPPRSSVYSESFRTSSRIFWEDAAGGKNILIGTNNTFPRPFVRGKSGDRELLHPDGRPLTDVGTSENPLTQVRLFSFVSTASVANGLFRVAPGPPDAIVTARCLIDPNDQATIDAQNGLGPVNSLPPPTGGNQLARDIDVYNLRVGEVIPIPHVWLQAAPGSVAVSSYSPGFLAGTIQPCQPPGGGAVVNLNLSLPADFRTLFDHLAPFAFAAPLAPLALQAESLSEEHPFSFSNARTEIAVRSFAQSTALVLGTSVEDDPLGDMNDVDDTLGADDFAFNVSASVVNRALDHSKGRFKDDFDSNKRDLEKVSLNFREDRMEVTTKFRFWVVGSKGSEIQDAVDVTVSNIFVEPRLFHDYAKNRQRLPVNVCDVPIVDPPSTQEALLDPSNPTCYFAFTYRRACGSPLDCFVPDDQSTNAGKKCLESGHDRDADGIYDAPNDGRGGTDLDDDNDGEPDDAEATDLDGDGRYGEREVPAADDDHDGRAGEFEDCDFDNDGRKSESEPFGTDLDGDGRAGELEPQPVFGNLTADADGDFRFCEEEFSGEDLDGDGRIGENEPRFADLNGDGDMVDAPDLDDDGDGILDDEPFAEDDAEPTYSRREIDDGQCPLDPGLRSDDLNGDSRLERCDDLFFPESRKVPDFLAYPQLEHIRGLAVGLDASDPELSVGNGITGAIINALDFLLVGGATGAALGALVGFFGRIEKRDGPFAFLFLSAFESWVAKPVLDDELQKLKPAHSQEQLVAVLPIANQTDLGLFVTSLKVTSEGMSVTGKSVVLHSLLSPNQTHPVNCAIATAAYGTPLAEEIQTLRELRDRILMRSRPGRRIVREYYRWAPPVARWLAKRPFARRFVRAGLWPIVGISKFFVQGSSR